jgi:hypothetical protein
MRTPPWRRVSSARRCDLDTEAPICLGTKNPINFRNTTEMRRSIHWIARFIVLVLAQTLGSLAVTSLVAGIDRTAVFLGVVPLITTLLCTSAGFRSKQGFLVVALATMATFGIIHLLRKSIDASWFAGPMPADVALAGYGALAILTFLCAGIACLVFSSRGALRKSRWAVVGVIAGLLMGLAVLARRSVAAPSPSSLLQSIVRIEQQPPADPGTMQELSVMLASCGRESDAELATRRIVVGEGANSAPGQAHSRPIDVSKIHGLPWRDVLAEIASKQRLIIVMEAHNEPKHRQWIEQALSVLWAAGFHDYAAEGLSEPGEALKQRGYPVSSTGPYVSDPQFGNLLRTAIGLGFELHAYESHGTDFNEREYQQAANLAKLFSANPKLKLVVHAGYGHVLKTPRATGEKSMASHLWEMTGIEPYCIWQIWHSPEEGQARQLAQLLPAGSEPLMLSPVPNGLTDPQFSFPRGAVDAIVVHPPSVGGSSQRVHSFPSARHRVAGVWNGPEWPVLVGAFKKGESADAIALDQVMLREGERDFVLWIPDGDYEVRVYGMGGRVHAASPVGSPALKLTRLGG